MSLRDKLISESQKALEKSFDDTSMQLLIEIPKPYEERDENRILKLKAEQRLSAVIIQEFVLGTPIVMKIKEKTDINEKEKYELRKQISEFQRKQKGIDSSNGLGEYPCRLML